jgi:hypothetical protein
MPENNGFSHSSPYKSRRPKRWRVTRACAKWQVDIMTRLNEATAAAALDEDDNSDRFGPRTAARLFSRLASAAAPLCREKWTRVTLGRFGHSEN